MDEATKAAKRAAILLKRRDKIATDLALIDHDIRQVTGDYSRTMRIWGFTPLMMRQVCKSRGLLP